MINLKRYIGRKIEIIYVDRFEKISQRTIKVKGIEGEFIKAFCLDKNAARIFKMKQILSVKPAS
ncbi:hypothetical protein [Paenibacillus sp. FJAT-26967]|uniref:hypothetical protein n=1 Tax=Paenibacillus sp. FJAT-26967 TaxID=1729690 RepID=UPI000A9EBE79|nr:hypothetical protein [Paenibacillus sp. FJAT-26967]